MMDCSATEDEIVKALQQLGAHRELGQMANDFSKAMITLAERKAIPPRVLLTSLVFMVGATVMADADNNPANRERIEECLHFLQHVAMLSVEICGKLLLLDLSDGTTEVEFKIGSGQTPVKFQAGLFSVTAEDLPAEKSTLH